MLRYLGIPTISLPLTRRAVGAANATVGDAVAALLFYAARQRVSHAPSTAELARWWAAQQRAPPLPRLFVDAHAPPTTRLPANVNLPVGRAAAASCSCSPPVEAAALPVVAEEKATARGVFSLGRAELLRSRSVWGDGARLAALAEKLRGGRCVTVVALGGSITCGRNLRRQKDVEHDKQSAWPAHLRNWLDAAFPCGEHAHHHTVLNHCQGGTGSEYALHAFNELVPADGSVDAVLVEFAQNDAEVAMTAGSTVDSLLRARPCGARRCSAVERVGAAAAAPLELLLRRLLALPGRPAVVSLGALWSSAKGDATSQFLHAAEEAHLPVLRHYSIPAVSLRLATYPEMASQQSQPTSPLFGSRVWADAVHPTTLWQEKQARLVAFALELAHEDASLAAAAEGGGGSAAAGPSPLPAPLLVSDEAVRRFGAAAASVLDLTDAGAVGAAATTLVGWSVREDVAGKPGLIAIYSPTAPPPVAVLRLPPLRTGLVVVGFLRSYDAAFGRALVSVRDTDADGGKEHGRATLDGRWSRHTSVYQTQTLSGLPTGRELRLRVELLPPNGEARGAKMKLLQVALY